MAGNIDLPVNIGVNASELTRVLLDMQNGVKGAAEQLNRLLEVSVKKDVFLRTIVDTSGQKKVVAIEKEILTGEKDRLALAKAIQKELKTAEKIQAGSVTSLRQQVNEAAQARDGIAKYQKVAGGLTVINDQWTAQNNKLRELQKQLAAVDASGFWNKLKLEFNVGGLFNFLNGLTGLTQGLQSVSIVIGQFIGSINQTTDALANLQSFGLAFDAIGLGAAGANTALSESTRIASNLGASLTTIRNSFQQLSPVVLNSGGTLRDVSKISETLASRFAAFGISGDRARRVTNGVIQAFAKGRLQAEELTQQIAEADPAFGTDFAKALGISTQKLLELVKAGKITSDVLLETIPKLSKSSLLYGKLGTSAQDAARALIKTDKATGRPLGTIDQVRNKFATLNQLSFEKLAKAFEPALFALLELNAILVDFFTNASRSGALKALGNTLASIISGGNSLIKVLLEVANGLIIVLEPIARLINELLKLPVVSQAVGLAIISNLIGPIGKLREAVVSYAATNKFLGAGLVQSVASWRGFGQSAKNAADQAARSDQRINRLNGSVTKLQNNLQKSSEDQLAKMNRLAGMQDRLQTLRAADPLVVGSKSAQIASLSKAINDYSKEVSTADTRTRGIRDALDRTQARLEATQRSAAVTSSAFARFKTTVGGAISAVGGAVKGLVGAIGPLGIALIGISIAQGAYSTATQEAQLATERGANTIAQYKQLIQSLGETINEETIGISTLNKGEKAWLAYSVQVRDKIDKIKKALLEFDFLRFAKEAGPIGSIGTLIDSFVTGTNDASLATRVFSAELQASSAAIKNQIAEIKKTTIALVKYGTEAKRNKDPGKVFDVAARYKEGSDIIKETTDEVTSLEAKIKELEDSQKKSRTSEKDRDQLKQYKKELEGLRKELAAARLGFTEAGAQLELFSDEQLKQGASAVAALSERLKAFTENLNKAGAGTAEFGKYAALISATDEALKRSKTAAEDPYVLSVGIDRAQLDTINKLTENYIKLEKELSKPIADRSQESINNYRLEIAKLNTDLENLERRRIEIDVELKLKREAIRSDIISAQADIQLEPGPVRDITKLQAESAKAINDASFNFAQKAADAKELIASGSLTQERGSQKVKDAALDFLKNTRTAMANVVNRGREFADQLANAQNSLANLKLSKPEFFTPGELAANARSIREAYAKELAIPSPETGEVVTPPALTGTEQEQLRQMQDFITTRKEARGLNETIANINVSLKIATQLLARIAGVELQTLKAAGVDAGATIKDLAQGYQALSQPQTQPQISPESFTASSNSISFWFDERKKEWIALTQQQAEAIKGYQLYQNQIGGDNPAVQQQTSGLQSAINSLASGVTSSEQIANNINGLTNAPDQIFSPIANALQEAELAAYNIKQYFRSLDNTKISVNISSSPSIPGRWAGGPVTAGSLYKVNEIGQEGFLSNAGGLRSINRPPNAIWRAPSSGTVIPANIMSMLAAPSGRVEASRPVSQIGSSSSATNIARAIQAAVSNASSHGNSSDVNELARVQAHQAVQIGRLGAAVTKLAEKDWDVKVNVRQNKTNGYLDALTRRM